MTATLLRNGRPLGGTSADILVEGGRIATIGPRLDPPAGAAIEEGRGLLALPAFVEGHAHLDKTLWGQPWWRNAVGPRLIDRIETERRERARLGLDPGEQAERLARAFLARGTTRIRTHADIDTEIGTRNVEALIALRERMRGTVDIQVVAFPQSGLMIRPGTKELLEAALRGGADILGGIDPSGIDRDPKGHLDTVFALADRHGVPLDIHLHEYGELGAFALELMIERTRALGMAGRVVVSHAFCLAEAARAPALYEELAGAGIALCTTGAPARPVPSIRAARNSGVAIFTGNDGIRDTWTPFAAPDMLQRAMIVGLKNDLRADDELEMAFHIITGWAASACGFEGCALAPGERADLVLLDAENALEALVTQPPARLVLSHGRVVARDGALAT